MTFQFVQMCLCFGLCLCLNGRRVSSAKTSGGKRDRKLKIETHKLQEGPLYVELSATMWKITQ